MQNFTGKSGANIVINIAPWQDAKRLKMAVEIEAGKAGIKINTESDVSTLVAAILKIDGSPEVDALLWPCLARCTRNDTKILESTFDDAEARRDYYEIISACMKENFAPLAESLFSVLPPAVLALFTSTGAKTQKST